MECLVDSLPSARIAEWMNFLSSGHRWNDLWEPQNDAIGFKSGLLAIGHIMAKQALPHADLVDNPVEHTLWAVKQALAENSLMLQIMEDLWNDFPALAACITGETILVMSANLQGVHPHIMKPGFKKFLQMCLQVPASIAFDPELYQKTVNETARCYVELVNEVKHLELDAGHWHELWEEGESIGLCIILHYVKHEKRSRLQELGRIHNINACINSNIMRIRDGLTNTPGLVDELTHLWQERPDIASHVDGNTLQLLMSDFKGDTMGIRQCFAYLCHNLLDSWSSAGSTENPTAYLYTCVHNFISTLKGPDHSGRSPGRKSGSSRTSSSKARAQKLANKQLQIQVPGNLSALQIASHGLLSPTSPHTSFDSILSPRIMVPGSPQMLLPGTPGTPQLFSPTSSHTPMAFSPQFMSPPSPHTPMPFSPNYLNPTSSHLFMGGTSPSTPSHLSHAINIPNSPQFMASSSPQFMGPTSPQFMGPTSPQTPIRRASRAPFMPHSPSTPIQILKQSLNQGLNQTHSQQLSLTPDEGLTFPGSPTAHMLGSPPSAAQELLVSGKAGKQADPLKEVPWSFAGLCA